MARVLELSKQDKGGRSYGGGGGASSSSNQHASSSSAAPSSSRQPEPVKEEPPAPPELSQATSVRALYAYTPTNPTELAFLEGDVIKVIGRTYEQWWRGTLRGRVGIFPVNYVESLRSPTAEEMRREREDEDAVFRSVARFDELLERLRGVDVQRGERVEDSREIEELYASCVGMQGKITELIQKYATQKGNRTLLLSVARASLSVPPPLPPRSPALCSRPRADFIDIRPGSPSVPAHEEPAIPAAAWCVPPNLQLSGLHLSDPPSPPRKQSTRSLCLSTSRPSSNSSSLTTPLLVDHRPWSLTPSNSSTLPRTPPPPPPLPLLEAD